MNPPLDAFFHPAPDGGQRLYMHHTPPAGQPLRGALVYVHPWAEEMNKSRRMAALASRALAANGWAVLQPDLLGCGDSSGDFGDATWPAWTDDVINSACWLQARHPGRPLWLWGLRAGALLVGAAAARIPGPTNLLLWQPHSSGKVQLQQFLRLKAAAALADGRGQSVMRSTRSDLDQGRTVEVAGYALSPLLAKGLETAALQPPVEAPGASLVWLEVSSNPEPTLSPASAASLARWEAAGWAVDSLAVQGPPFWQTTEIEDAMSLVDATVACLNRATPLA